MADEEEEVESRARSGALSSRTPGASIRASAATRAYQRVTSNGSKSPAMEPT